MERAENEIIKEVGRTINAVDEALDFCPPRTCESLTFLRWPNCTTTQRGIDWLCVLCVVIDEIFVKKARRQVYPFFAEVPEEC